jgi:urease accessory protein
VRRTTRLDVAADARVSLRETVVLGRSGELGGPLRSQTNVRVGGGDVWVEDQLLHIEQGRSLPGVMGENRVLDTLLTLGELPVRETVSPAVRFLLPGGVGSVVRYLGRSLAASPLNAGTRSLVGAVR